MAVDSLRETRHINRVRACDLTPLWTAQSYRPEITSAIFEIRNLPRWLPLGEMCEQPIAQGRTPTYATDGNGYPCLKTKHVNGLIIEENELDLVTRECANALTRFKVATSTVLMNRSGAGSIGRCSVYLGSSAPLTNEHLLHIRVALPHDPCFVAAYLSTWWGERAIEQGITGSTGQLNLANEHVARVPVPCPSPAAQRYIGDKIRQAKQLRERARHQRSGLANLLALEGVAEALARQESLTNRITVTDLRPRLDAKYYSARLLAVLKSAARESVPLASLVDEVSNGFEHRTFVADGTRYITVTDVSAGRLVLDSAPMIPREVPVPDKARVDARCALVVRTGVGIGTAVKVFEQDSGASISSHLIRLRCATEEVAAVVAAFLNSPVGLALQQRISYGVAQPQIGQEELLALPIPSVILARADSILKALETEDAALRAAASLTSASKQLVEQLIEGRLFEADLVAAQQALGSGDRAADRALLQTLRQGDAENAVPPFADLDWLYDLLDADEEGGD